MAAGGGSILNIPSIAAAGYQVGQRIYILNLVVQTNGVTVVTSNLAAGDTIAGILMTAVPAVVQKTAAASITIAATGKAGDWIELTVVNAAGGANAWACRGMGTAIS